MTQFQFQFHFLPRKGIHIPSLERKGNTEVQLRTNVCTCVDWPATHPLSKSVLARLSVFLRSFPWCSPVFCSICLFSSQMSSGRWFLFSHPLHCDPLIHSCNSFWARSRVKTIVRRRVRCRQSDGCFSNALNERKILGKIGFRSILRSLKATWLAILASNQSFGFFSF